MSEIPKPEIAWTNLQINVQTRQIVAENYIAKRDGPITDLWIPRDIKTGDEISFDKETHKILNPEELKQFGITDLVDYKGQAVPCWVWGEPLNVRSFDKLTGILLWHGEKFHHDRLLDSNVSIGKSPDQKIPFEGMNLRYVAEIYHGPLELATFITDYNFTRWIDTNTIECTRTDYPVGTQPLLTELLDRMTRLETSINEANRREAQLENDLKGIRNDLNQLRSRRELIITTITTGVLVSLAVGLTLTFLFWLIGILHLFP